MWESYQCLVFPGYSGFFHHLQLKSHDVQSVYNRKKATLTIEKKTDSLSISGSQVTANALHPGLVKTEIGRHLGISKSYISSFILGPFVWLLLKTPSQGAQTSIYCALEPNLQNVSGKYFR